MWVKICGNTNLEDAALAVELGADAVGFVFAASKRQVTAAQVGAITPHLPIGAERVGVFSSQDPEEIIRTASDAGLTTVQLHGGLDQRLLERLAQKFAGSVGIIQTLHWIIDELDTPPRQSSAEPSPHQSPSMLQLSNEIDLLTAQGIADRVLIDSKVGLAGGGTGVAYDWSAARSRADFHAVLYILVTGRDSFVFGFVRTNTCVRCRSRKLSTTDFATRLSTTRRSWPFLTRSPGMMKTDVLSSGTLTSKSHLRPQTNHYHARARAAYM